MQPSSIRAPTDEETRSESPQGPAKKRRRPPLACTQCRRRKMKCDQSTPCNNCAKSSIKECIYPPAQVPAGRTPRAGVSAGARSAPPIAPRTPPVDQGLRLRPVLEKPSIAPGMEILLARIGGLEKSVAALSRRDCDCHRGGDGNCVEEHPPANDAALPGPRFANQSSWMNHTSLYSRVLRCLSQAQADKLEFRQTISQCKALGRRFGDKLTAHADAPVRTSMPEKAAADRLIDAYFRSFEGVFRVLHVPSFRAEYEGYWREPGEARDMFLLQVQVCMALGTMAVGEPFRFGDAPAQWLLEARTWTERASGGPRKRHVTIEELQLSCLLCLAEANGPATERVSWIDAGDLVRKAMTLNLHRDPSHLGIGKLQEAEMRCRLWATIMELNLLLSLQAAQPPLISASDWDSRVPVALSDEVLVEGGDQSTDSQAGRDTEVCPQTALHESFRLRLQVASRVNASGSGLSCSETLRLHADLTRALERLKTELQVRPGDKTENSHGPLAEVIFCRYILALHLPVLARSIKDPVFHFSRRACVAVAIEMRDTYDVARARANLGRTGYEGLLNSSSGLFRGLAMQPMFAVLLELVTFAEEKMENKGAFPAWDENQIRQHAEGCQAWAEGCARRGFNDVHACSFIAACRAYAAALAIGLDREEVDRAMIAAALESSKRCLDGLTEWAEKPDGNSGGGTAEVGQMGDAIGSDMGSSWQADLGLEDMDDFFGFDWTFSGDPGMLSADMNLMVS